MTIATLTAEERKAINDLRLLADRWPPSLKLFAWAGHLHVLKPGGGRTFQEADVAAVTEIQCDGGDPNYNDIA